MKQRLKLRKLQVLSVFLFVGIGMKAFSFPRVTDWKNSPVIVFENKKQAILRKNLLLKSPFAVVTANHDQLGFKINIFDNIVVYPKSKVQVLEFSNETGFVTEFYILDGQIRYTTEHQGLAKGAAKDEAAVTLKTPFFDLKAASVVDFIINLNMKEPSVEIKMISGVLPLGFFAYEKTVILKAGESVKFTGLLSDDGSGVKYDYLLNNRKVPKGALEDVQKFDQSLFIKAEKNLAVTETKKNIMLKQKVADKKRKQKEYEDSFLCKNPFGHKDQCAWRLEDDKCYRKRCNVSGAWGELIERPITELCKKDFFIKQCDY